MSTAINGNGSVRCGYGLTVWLPEGLAANLAANPPDLGGRIQTRMDFAQRTWTQPAVLLATRNA